MAKVAFDLWWEWVEKPADSMSMIPAHFQEAILHLPPDQRYERYAVNEAVRLADPDAQNR